MLLLAPANACLLPLKITNSAEQQDYFYILFNSEKQLGLRPFAIYI